MPLINTSLPNLIQGVSQQPDTTRFEGQCEEQENALSSIVEGLSKRPNTRHIAKVFAEAISEDSFVHFIKRSYSEQYVIVHNGTTIRAFNLINGEEARINGVYFGYTPAAGHYLNTSNPFNHLKALTVADTTFLLNRTVAVGYKQDNGALAYTPPLANKALIFVKQATREVKYGISLTGGLVEGTGATADVTFEYYVYSSKRIISRYRASSSVTYYFRSTIKEVNVTDGGANYKADNITFDVVRPAGIDSTFDKPSITFSVTDGVINLGTGHTINYGGSFSGPVISASYSQQIDTPADVVGSLSNINTPFYEASGSTTNEAFIESADSSTHPERVQADVILSELIGDADGATHDDDIQSIFSTNFNYKQNPNTNLIEIERHDGADFSIAAIDGSGGGRLGVVYKEVSSITDLPLIAPDGFIVKVVGSGGVDEDDYYVKFKTVQGHETIDTSNTNPDAQGTGVAAANITSTVGEGIWQETVAPNILKGVDPSTMFHSLVSTGLNEFVVEETNIAERLVGDDKSNPLPSFEAATIDNLFFYRNRLGVLSGDNVIMAESGLGGLAENNRIIYNFGRTTVQSLLDSDPIDISAASSRVTSFEAAVGFQENLILFSDNTQFVLEAGDVLTPRTVSVTPVTTFEAALDVTPLALGSYIYFPFNKGDFSGIREYTVNSTTDNYDAAEITEHVPAYIPQGVRAMTATSTENIIAVLSSDEPSTIYIYKYFWSGAQKLLSSWSKFTVKGEIRSINFIESSLYIVLAHNSETHLLEMPLVSNLKDQVGYNTYLDQRVQRTVASSAITLPYTPESSDVIEVYTVDGAKVTTTRNGDTITIDDDEINDTDEVYAGYPYTMKYKFSEQLFRAAASGQTNSPSAAARMQIRNLSLFFDKTAYFKVKITPKGRAESVYEFSPDPLAFSNTGYVTLDKGSERFYVLTSPEDADITIENNSALPSHFQSAEFESFIESRSTRYAR